MADYKLHLLLKIMGQTTTSCSSSRRKSPSTRLHPGDVPKLINEVIGRMRKGSLVTLQERTLHARTMGTMSQ